MIVFLKRQMLQNFIATVQHSNTAPGYLFSREVLAKSIDIFSGESCKEFSLIKPHVEESSTSTCLSMEAFSQVKRAVRSDARKK